MIPVGKLVLNENPRNYFTDVEQSAFSPGHMIPGIGPSPDKVLQVEMKGNIRPKHWSASH